VRRGCVVVLCIFLAACSGTRFVYNQLDWVMVWYLNGYFSLDSGQKDQLRDSVTRNLEWHRETQLPEYAAYSRQLGLDSAGTLTTETLELRYERLIKLFDELVVHALPDVSAFFLSLSDEQVDEFIENLEDNNKELWDEYGGETPEQRIERREKAAFKGFKRVIGRLNDEQKELIRAYMANMHDVSEYWIESRRRWQLEFRELIIERPAEPEFSDRLNALMLDPNRDDDPAYRRKVDENRLNFFALTAALSGTLTDRQRERFQKRITNYAEDFEILAMQKT
jgi:hypothetical protein